MARGSSESPFRWEFVERDREISWPAGGSSKGGWSVQVSLQDSPWCVADLIVPDETVQGPFSLNFWILDFQTFPNPIFQGEQGQPLMQVLWDAAEARGVKLGKFRRPKPGSYVSASQIETFSSCNRKWAWNYIFGVREPEKASAACGTRIHEMLELWLKEGKAIDVENKEGKAAFALTRYLPAPGSPGMEVEATVALQVEDVEFFGYADVVYVDEQDRVHVMDHKSTSDLMWAKHEDQLREDAQATIYAYWAMARFQTDDVYLAWNYVNANTAQTQPVRLHPDIATIERTMMERLVPTARLINRHRQSNAHPIDVDFNIDSCGMYGGCGYQKQCKISGVQYLTASFKQQKRKKETKEIKMSMSDILSKKIAAKNGQAVPARDASTGARLPPMKAGASKSPLTVAAKPSLQPATKPSLTVASKPTLQTATKPQVGVPAASGPLANKLAAAKGLSGTKLRQPEPQEAPAINPPEEALLQPEVSTPKKAKKDVGSTPSLGISPAALGYAVLRASGNIAGLDEETVQAQLERYMELLRE